MCGNWIGWQRGGGGEADVVSLAEYQYQEFFQKSYVARLRCSVSLLQCVVILAFVGISTQLAHS